MKFTELSDREKVSHLRESFNGIIECIYSNTGDLEKNLSPEDFEAVKKFSETIRQPDCTCGDCVDLTKVTGRIPPELKPIVNLAKKRCEERQF